MVSLGDGDNPSSQFFFPLSVAGVRAREWRRNEKKKEVSGEEEERKKGIEVCGSFSSFANKPLIVFISRKLTPNSTFYFK